MHVFVLVRDGADIQRFLRVLHDRCWLAGLGWLTVGAGGQMLSRSLIDRSVFAGERLVFEGPPIMVAPLVQDQSRRGPIVKEGPALDTRLACPDLSIVEGATLRDLDAAERRRLASQAAKAKADFIATHGERIVARTGCKPEVARRAVERQCEGILLPDIVLLFDDEDLAGKGPGHPRRSRAICW